MKSTTKSFILKEIKENIGFITLNNPEKHNALNAQMLREIIAALDDFKAAKVTVVIIRAREGVKVWSAGYDISQLPEAQKVHLGYENPLEVLLLTIQEYPGPVIAMVHGSVWGGACDLAITCDMIIGDPTCAFAITPAKIGIAYNASGILHFINRVGMNIAKEMFFSALPLDAYRAERFGILNHLVPTESLESFTLDLAQKIACRSTLSIAVMKEQFRILSEAHPISSYAFERIQSLRRKLYDSPDYEEGIRAFLERREPDFNDE
jgi:methylmalonyl-CoA decarboxylase